MGWFGSGGTTEKYDKNGKAQLTSTEAACLVRSLGTNDLDQLIAAAAPGLIGTINSQTKGIQLTYNMVKELTQTINQQKEQIDKLNKKLEALER